MAPKLMKASDLAKQAGLQPQPAEPFAMVPSGDPSLKAASSKGKESASAPPALPPVDDDSPFVFFG